MSDFQGDVLLLSTPDGGDLLIENDFIVATGGFETATYLSLFGGNKRDDGTEATKKKSWWGNQLDDNEPNKKLISRTQNFMLSNPATPGNLNKIIENAKLDLAWFKDEGICDTIEVTGRIPEPDRLELSGRCLKDGDLVGDFKFLENWKAAEAGR